MRKSFSDMASNLVGAAAFVAVLYWGGTFHGTRPTPAPHPDESEPEAAATAMEPTPSRPVLTSDERWAAAKVRLKQAGSEQVASQRLRVMELEGYFEERKQGIEPFAAEVLGLRAKLEQAYAVAGDWVESAREAISGLFWEPEMKITVGPYDNRFGYMASEMYRRHIVGSSDVGAAATACFDEFLTDLCAIEGRCLVDIEVDIDEMPDAVSGKPLPNLTFIDLADAEAEAIKDVVAIAGTDIAVAFAQEAVGQVAGDRLVGALASGVKSSLLKFGINVGTGVAVSNKLSDALEAAGYTPEAEIAERVVRAVDCTRDLVIAGDPDVIKFHAFLFNAGLVSGDPGVRAACQEAVRVLESDANLGLRYRMQILGMRRGRALAIKAYAEIMGRDMPAGEGWEWTTVPCEVPAATIIKFSRDVIQRYGVKP